MANQQMILLIHGEVTSPEIDIFDNLYSDDNGSIAGRELATGVIDHSGQQPSFANFANKLNGFDLSASFNKYTAVWTPEYITFFFNERELYSL